MNTSLPARLAFAAVARLRAAAIAIAACLAAGLAGGGFLAGYVVGYDQACSDYVLPQARPLTWKYWASRCLPGLLAPDENAGTTSPHRKPSRSIR